MRRVLKFLGLTLLLAIAFLAILAGHALTLRSKQITSDGPLARVDTSRVANRLAEAIRIRTVSTEDGNTNRDEFLRFHEWLAATYPRIHATLRRETVSDLSLLYSWPGTEPQLRPVLLLAHMDVVPAGDDGPWKHPPFDGIVTDGTVWGRGALDDKASLVALMEAAESRLEQGFRPRRTVYIALGHDEEKGGQGGARKIAELLEKRGVKPEFVLDEGGAVTRGLVQGIAGPVAAVAIAEKGVVNFELTATGIGGHSSAPPPTTPIAAISRAVTRIAAHPMPARLAAPVRATLEYVAPEAPIGQRLMIGNLWATAALLPWFMEKTPSGNAQVRTTCVTTIVQAGSKSNVIPASARAVVNCRVLPGDSVAAVKSHLERVVDDPSVQVKGQDSDPGAPAVSSFESNAALALKRSIGQTYPEAVVAPMMTTGATDARHYTQLSEAVYRFAPFTATPEAFHLIHGTDERISIEDCRRAVQFYAQLLSNVDRGGEVDRR